MDRQMKDAFCRLIDPELEKISKLPALDNATLNNLHMLVVTKEKLLRIEQIENELNGNMMGGNSFRDGRSYPMSYDMQRGNSYDRAYPNSYDDGYSRMDTYSHLEAAMRDARNDQEREEIRKLMTRYHN